MTRIHRWVLVETGGNQAYIFDTNRLRDAVGASQRVHDVGTAWVGDAADRAGAQVVMAISGKALLLVDDGAVGRRIVGELSARALREAPGLEVTGVVGPPFDADAVWRGDTNPAGVPQARRDSVSALDATVREMGRVRAARPSAVVRDPVLPWSDLCRHSGLPTAVHDTRHPDGPQWISAPVWARSQARDAGRQRMSTHLGDARAFVIPRSLDDLGEDGWIAVIHADGNGVGRVFVDFAHRALAVCRAEHGPDAGVALADHCRLMSAFAEELDQATWVALRQAVDTVAETHEAEAAILPIVVGGDDVTVACHARLALPLVRGFLLAFEQQTAGLATLPQLVGAPQAPRGLTAAAGVVFVKPHHPFSTAYALAEDLTASAKTARGVGDSPVSAVDLHVAFESTLGTLEQMRRPVSPGSDDLPRHGGPYTMSGGTGSTAGPRDITRLDRSIDALGRLSSSMAHDLREGLARGRAELELRITRAATAPDLPEGLTPQAIEALRPAVDGQDTIVRLLDAMLLRAVVNQ